MMNNLISAIEMAIIIILPLILFYQRKKIHCLPLITHVVLLYAIWFSTYALIHELSHLFGTWITGAKVLDYQLMPKFWEGDFKTGYIRTDYDSSFQEFVVLIIPYFKNIILLAIGYIALNHGKKKSHFLVGLILVLLILSPLYDVVNNYFAFVLGALNDFNAMRNFTGNSGAHIIGISITLFSLFINYKIIFSKIIKEENGTISTN